MQKLDVVLTRNECLEAIADAARQKVLKAVSNLSLKEYGVERLGGIVIPASAEIAIVTLAPPEAAQEAE